MLYYIQDQNYIKKPLSNFRNIPELKMKSLISPAPAKFDRLG